MEEGNKNPIDQTKASLTADELMRFFAFAKDKDLCPCCGSDTWDLAEPPSDLKFNLLTTLPNGELIQKPPKMPLIVLLCTQCFFVRQHAMKPLLKWLSDNPKPDEAKENLITD